MDDARIEDILRRIAQVQVAVYGDFCIDAYWVLDPQGSEVSVETGQKGEAVRDHYYTLGGASNIVANLAALAPAAIRVIGVVGNDIYGREMMRQFHELGVDTRALVVQDEDFDTVTFGKRYLDGTEQPRIDFGFFNARSRATDQRLLTALEEAMATCNAVILNQQVPGSIPDTGFIDAINRLAAAHPDLPVLADSRHYGSHFSGVSRKTNEVECARLNGVDADLGDVFSLNQVGAYAGQLFQACGRPVFVTRGARGILVVDADGIHEIPGIQLTRKLDPVGAGDTTISALALCLGAGCTAPEAAAFANLAAAVTVQKLYQTGTASGDEILALGRDPDYIYQPELADDARRARYIDNTDIECCGEAPPRAALRHAVFDHDGTISTLRQGWEEIMAPVMIQAILGDRRDTVDPTLYQNVRRRVLEYIDASTGIQTILQMEALADMVAEFRLVPAEKRLDPAGYKAMYNDALMASVNARIDRLTRGEREVADLTVKGAVNILRRLRDRGVTLYLASGTDREDVSREAAVLGYADLFNGGIYGAVGDVSKYSKKMVIADIMQKHGLSGPELLVVGDGPVEIRECRKRQGIAVGVASDEVRRYGLCPEKRTRLIKAGADLIIPDFSQADALVSVLFGSPD